MYSSIIAHLINNWLHLLVFTIEEKFTTNEVRSSTHISLFYNCTFLLSNEETKVCTLTKLYKLGSKKEPMYVKQIGFNWAIVSSSYCSNIVKVKTLWKGHKIGKNIPLVLTKQLFLLISVKISGRFFQIYVAFSEKLNFSKWIFEQ